MSRRYRLIFLGFSFIILLIVGRVITEEFDFLLQDFWFTSGILLLVLLSLIDQPHFSKDSSIFLNAITGGIALLLVEPNERTWVFWIFFISVLYLAISSYIILWIRSKISLPESQSVLFISRLNKIIGRPECLFSAFFLWGAIIQFGIDSSEFNALLLFWVIFIILNVPSLSKVIDEYLHSPKEEKNENSIGQIFGVQSKNTFLIKLFDERPNAKVFDFVEFKYSVDEKIRKGLILDIYLLNQEQWIKVLTNNEIERIFKNGNIFSSHDRDIVYIIKSHPENNYLNSFVGIVSENSRINRINFSYNSKINIEEGQLLEITINKNKVLYQVVDGVTRIEQLENKNLTGLITGEAIQLGKWDDDKSRFELYGWVPDINSPVYLASKVREPQLEQDEYVIGYIPESNFPTIINKKLCVTHHTAILGVTGTGKSIFTRNLLRQLILDDDAKVICIDFTKEYSGKFSDISHKDIVNSKRANRIFKCIDWLSNELEKFGNQQNKEKIATANWIIRASFLRSINEFLNGTDKLAIFELPDVSNTSGILEYTRHFFQTLFLIARERNNYGKRICVVLEEAHTVVPEWNFIGISEKSSQSLVNNISQIALQGRKYDIGFFVIAQRSANVSKTVLTQCNSIISFQLFDKTSNEFISNYFGADIAEVLPKLKTRQAVAAGKAFKSNVPMIFKVPEINE